MPTNYTGTDDGGEWGEMLNTNQLVPIDCRRCGGNVWVIREDLDSDWEIKCKDCNQEYELTRRREAV